MSLWNFDFVRADGDIFAYVRIQNEYSGNISGSFRKVFQDKNCEYYFKADGRKHFVTNYVNRFLAEESKRKEMIDFYHKYACQIGGYKRI